LATFCVCGTFCAVTCKAAEAAVNEPLNANLTVVPRICVLSETAEKCEQFIHLSWSTPHQQNVCLYNAADQSILKCWEQVQQGEIDMLITVDETVSFELRDAQDNLIVIAKTEFKVMRDQKQYRRSRRNPWSFF